MEELEDLRERIESYIRNWQTQDTYGDFRFIEDIYCQICDVLGREPKDLRKLAGL